MGPLLDRIDLFMFLEPIKIEDYQAQQEAIQPVPPRTCKPNGLLSDAEVQKIKLTPAVQRLRLSSSGYFKTIKIAKTIAELDGQADSASAYQRSASLPLGSSKSFLINHPDPKQNSAY